MTTLTKTLQRYDNYLQGKEPTPENAEELIRTLYEKQLKPSYINIEKSRLRSFFRHNNIEIPPKMLVLKNKTNVREDKFVRWDDVQKWYGLIHKKRDKAILLMLYTTGARANELLNIDIGDFDFSKGREIVKIKGLKSSAKVRLTPIIFPDSVFASLSRYLEDRGIDFKNPTPKQQKEPLFLAEKKPFGRLQYAGLYDLITRFRTITGHPEISPHWFRHSYCVWAKINGVPVDDVARAIGDTPETASKIYSHFGTDDMIRSFGKAQGVKVEKLPENIDLLDEFQKMRKELDEHKEIIADIMRVLAKLKA